ncbi:MAG: hypothetical protein QXR91_08370 [Nitrososphaerales archaeon]
MPKKKIYSNIYRITGSPQQAAAKVEDLLQLVKKIQADQVEVVAKVNAYNVREWFTSKKLALISIIVTVILFLVGYLLKTL